MTERKRHSFDEEGICTVCGYDGAGGWWELDCLRMEIGDDEFNHRREAGEFDFHRFCDKAVAA